jgi:hypothetical protein
VCEAAFQELRGLEGQAEVELRAALRQGPSAEKCRQLVTLLDALKGTQPTAEQLRVARGLEVFGQVASAEALRLLEELATGAVGARQTREARAALERLARRVARPMPTEQLPERR